MLGQLPGREAGTLPVGSADHSASYSWSLIGDRFLLKGQLGQVCFDPMDSVILPGSYAEEMGSVPGASCPETEDPISSPWVRCPMGEPSPHQDVAPHPGPGVAHIVGPMDLATSATFLKKPSCCGYNWGSPSGLG